MLILMIENLFWNTNFDLIYFIVKRESLKSNNFKGRLINIWQVDFKLTSSNFNL